MSRLDQAADRLQAAFERLENAPPALRCARHPPSGWRNWRPERERLLARIASLEDDMAALTGITEEVEDGAVEFRPRWRSAGETSVMPRAQVVRARRK